MLMLYCYYSFIQSHLSGLLQLCAEFGILTCSDIWQTIRVSVTDVVYVCTPVYTKLITSTKGKKWHINLHLLSRSAVVIIIS